MEAQRIEPHAQVSTSTVDSLIKTLESAAQIIRALSLLNNIEPDWMLLQSIHHGIEELKEVSDERTN